MNDIVSIFFNSNLKLRIENQNAPADGEQYDLLYYWTDDHWYDLLSLLGERYVLYGYYNELSYQFMSFKIFDLKLDLYLSKEQKIAFLKGHRYIQSIERK
jgi:hypothetical protein